MDFYSLCMGRQRLFNDKEKWCNKCESWLPLEEFGVNKRRPSGRADYCKSCIDTNYHEGVSFSDYYRQRQYNLSPEQHKTLLDRQGRQCAICDQPFLVYEDRRGHQFQTSCVDRNHKTGFVRGLLCRRCNMMLGHLNEDVTKLEKAIQYLKAEFETQV